MMELPEGERDLKNASNWPAHDVGETSGGGSTGARQGVDGGDGQEGEGEQGGGGGGEGVGGGGGESDQWPETVKVFLSRLVGRALTS